MGELYRKKQAELKEVRRSRNSANGEQLALLRRLCIDDEGDVDEAWLATLTVAQASAAIGRRLGVAGARKENHRGD